jgi:hypothetical protein
MSAWIPLTATQDTTLAELLQANGLPTDGHILRNIWSAPQNLHNHQRSVRAPHTIRSGETWYVPPPPLPVDGVLQTYTCTGSERSADEIAQTIRTRHGAGARDELTVAPERFTGAYLLGLAHNQAFRLRRSATPPAPIAAGETVRYPTRTRRAHGRGVAPSTSMNRSLNALQTGDGPFTVRVELARRGQVMKILNMIPEPQQVNARDPNATLAAQWRPSDGKVRFKVTITPREGPATPTRVTIRVRSPQGVYCTQVRTDWTRTGEHIWEWDGFTTPAPAQGARDVGQADTRILRGRLTIEVVVQAASGWSLGSLELANTASRAGFVDVHAKLDRSEIDAFAYLEFHHANQDAGTWAMTVIGGLVAGGLVAGAIAIAMKRDSDVHGGLTPEQQRNYAIAMGVAGAVTAAAFIGIIGGILRANRLSDADFNTLRERVITGMRTHWGRRVEIDHRTYDFRVQVDTSEGHDRIRYALQNSGIGRGALNLGTVVFLPLVPEAEANEYGGAHEFGHSIMLAAGDVSQVARNDWSIRHKGSTDYGQHTRGEFRRPTPPAHSDLMIYYDDQPGSGWSYSDVRAAVADVLSWIEIAQIEFRAA